MYLSSLISLKYGCIAHFLFQNNQGYLKTEIYLKWVVAVKIYNGLYKHVEFTLGSLQNRTQLTSVICEAFGETDSNYEDS